MLGYVLLYFLGRAWFKLAEKHGRSKWGWAVSNVLGFLAFQVLMGVGLAVVLELQGTDAEAYIGENELMVTLIAGVLTWAIAIGVYFLVKRRWEDQAYATPDLPQDILDRDLSDA